MIHQLDCCRCRKPWYVTDAQLAEYDRTSTVVLCDMCYMSDMRLVLYPDPILSTSMPLLAFPDEAEIEAFINLFNTFPNGAGIAANQLNIRNRYFVFRTASGSEPVFAYDPEITRATTHKVKSREGCLSIPDFFVDRMRSRKITVSYTDADNKRQTGVQLQGFPAFVFQHELDHLNGITIKDKQPAD